MSSKVVTGSAAADVPVIAWHKVPASASPVWKPDPVTLSFAAGPHGEPAKVQLEARAADLERRVQLAREEGRREAEAEASRRASEQLEPVLRRFSRTVEELARCRGHFRREAEQDLVRLALAIARRLVRRELSIDAGVMLGVVKAALAQLDLRETHRLRLHPLDVPAVEPHLASLGLPSALEIAADASLERGAAVFETRRGEMDASLETQLAEIGRGLADLTGRRS